MSVAENIDTIKSRIREAEKKYHRDPNSVCILAVSKKHRSELIREAYEAGQSLFAENYVQEAIEKQEVLAGCDIEWHFIGAIQSNKTKLVASHFSWAHSVDRFKIAKRLSEQRPDSMPPLNICIEVNISDEPTKSGVMPEALDALVSQIATLDRVCLRGLMVIPEQQLNFEQQKRIFDKVYALQNQLVDKGFKLDTLSMGMSQDFEAAIAAGSTIVRIGTAIFGERYK